jgi:predicted NBD/HSP70 family sugar kinase
MEEHGGREGAWAVGLAAPGFFEAGPAFDLPPGLPEEWGSVDLAGQLVLAFGAPAYVRGATELMAMGELKAGAGARDMLFVKLGRTISAGVVANGRLYRGAHGAAGLIGNVQTGARSPVACRCGSRGCLEVVTGADAIARLGREAAGGGESRYLAETLARSGEVTAADVGHGAQLGDAFCAELIARCGRIVGEALAPLANLLNPAMVVLGGSVSQAGDILLAAVREALYRQAHPLVTRDLRIVRSQMGSSSGLVGAAEMVADAIFAPEVLAEWVAMGSPRRMPKVAEAMAEARASRRRPPAPGPAADRRSGRAEG